MRPPCHGTIIRAVSQPQPAAPARPGALRSLAAAMASRRTAAVSLLSFSQGLPLGMVWIAVPDWMRSVGVDIRIVGLFTLAQAPWSFKILWSPLMDRYGLPWLGRRRGWAALAQLALFVATILLAGVGERPETPWVVLALALAIALASATQDIAVDAYTVEVLRPGEDGIAAGARVALYRAAMFLAGVSITLAGRHSWPLVNAVLAFVYLPMLLVTWKAPEPELAAAPPRTLREAVWHPFLGMLARHRALEILAFVLLYKIADNLALALLRPFLIDKGYTDLDRGLRLSIISMVCTAVGALAGGALTTSQGLGRSLWISGFLQIFSNLGYVLVARAGIDRPLMYGANAFETLTSGMGTGAFTVLMMRLTQKRFSATQFALLSSLFGLPRIISGPISGVAVHALGWEWFFWATILAGVPGMVLLQRFAPLGVRDPVFTVEPPHDRRPLTGRELAWRGLCGGAVCLFAGALCVASMAALRHMRAGPGAPFDLAGSLISLACPATLGEWLQSSGLLVFAVAAGLGTAAVYAVRHGAAGELGIDEPSAGAAARPS